MPYLVVLVAVGLPYGGGPSIFRDVSLALAPGSFHFLVGPSGAGKSSLLRLMYLAVRPAEGRMTLFGRQVARLTRRELPVRTRNALRWWRLHPSPPIEWWTGPVASVYIPAAYAVPTPLATPSRPSPHASPL